MASGMWPAVSGAIAQSRAIDTVSNNLANSNTDGFKKDTVTFKKVLDHEQREFAHSELQKQPFPDDDIILLEGSDQDFVVADRTTSDFSQGSFKVTNAPLDVALNGPGFLEVSTSQGLRYTRYGGLKISGEGLLMTSDGYPVLASQSIGLVNALPGQAVQPISQGRQRTQGGVSVGQIPPETLARYIQLGDREGSLAITEGGEIYIGEELIAKLNVVEFKEPKNLEKNKNLLFHNKDVNNISPNQKATKIFQGMIEKSNVNPVKEMTQLIQSQRMFEHNLKAIKTYDSLMNKEANEVGKL